MAVNGRHSVEQFTALAVRWRRAGYADSVFWLADPTDAEHAAALTRSGFECTGPGVEHPINTLAKVPRAKTTNRIPARMVRGRLFGVRGPRRTRSLTAERGKQRRTECDVRLRELSVSAVITSQERPFEFLALLAAAQARHIPVLLLPANYLCEPDGGAFTRAGDPSLDPDLSRVSAFFERMTSISGMNQEIRDENPKQIFTTRDGVRMLCYPGDYLLGLRDAGLLTENMWYQGTRFVDRVVISGDDEQAVCEHAGIPSERIAKIGAVPFDMIAESLTRRADIRRQLAAAHRIDPDRRILMLSVPTLWEHNMITRKEDQFVEEILSTLRGYDGSILLSMHPRARAADYRALADRHGAAILEQPLIEVIVAADAFVASAYSSTIRWAIGLGLPTLNLDLWDLNESTYRAYPDYPNATSIEQFRAWIEKISHAPWTGPGPLIVPDRNLLGIRLDDQFSVRMRALVEAVIPAGASS